MTNALKIRQKFINLMYLVFILFAFIYAPTNSLDSLFYSTKSMKRVAALMVPLNATLKTSITSDTAFVTKNTEVYQTVMAINDSIDNLINKLDSFQIVLIEPQFKDKSGFPRNFRSSSLSNKTFIYSGAGEQMRKTIEKIEADLVKLGLEKLKLNIDTVLPSKPTMINSKNLEQTWSAFFFKKTPKAVLLLTTEKMKLDLLVLSNNVLNHLNGLRNKTVGENPSTLFNNNTMFVVKLLNGEEVPLKLDWTAAGSDANKQRVFEEVLNNKLTGTLTKDGIAVSEATFNQKPMPPPPPPTPVKPDQLFASIGKGAYDELYLGIDNPIDIVTSIPPGYRSDVTITEGKIESRNGRYFMRFKKEGYTKVSVYAVKGSERKLMDQKEFKIILIPNPDVYLSGYKGGVISKDIVKVAKNIELKNEASNLGNDVYTCQNFDVTLVPFDNPIQEIKVRGNNGTTFSQESKDILKNVKRGDVIVLDNFKIVTPEGIIRRIPTVVYRVI